MWMSIVKGLKTFFPKFLSLFLCFNLPSDAFMAQHTLATSFFSG